jgi:hypothetical protein
MWNDWTMTSSLSTEAGCGGADNVHGQIRERGE